ncbi:uncharacterized protein LOC122503338 [Leptopilina heterotoma]|uniref:uncharacterized protein LOC122503338 n=1 Tax=Leptopilina heterotoma TaxID=63436 RepID=UPI001CA88D67|nr:uncharacterized protein LOC122503338 [Leptopilina heterotoma]
MHLEYRVQLPDHDWVVAGGHKLIPSVYAGIVIKDGPIGKKTNVSYSGPTYIAIRSAKHNSSTASTHAFDLKRLLELESFNTIMRNSNGSIKPVLILSVDGGPDENPRYEKVIAHAINHFKEFDLDGIFIFTNAPNRSAFNRVERRMAPLSRELTGVILPHDKFGKHLGDNGETIDSQLELENFEHAGNILSDIWSNTKIDGFEVFAEYISPSLNENLESPEVPSPTWYCKHVFESQYFLQIIKCDNVSCCQPLRSDLKKVLIFGRLLPPIPVLRDQSGLRIPSPNEGILTTFASLLQRHSLDLKPNHDGFLIMPYDMYCPSVQSDLLNRTCKYCGFYTATKKSAQKHKKSLHPYGVLETSRIRPLRVVARRAREALCYVTHISGEEAEWIDIEDIDEQFINNETESSQTNKELLIPVVTSFENWLQNPFIEDCDYTIEDNMRY